MKVSDLACRFRAILLTNSQKAIFEFQIIAKQQHLKKLFKRKLRLLDIQLLVLIIHPSTPLALIYDSTAQSW